MIEAQVVSLKLMWSVFFRLGLLLWVSFLFPARRKLLTVRLWRVARLVVSQLLSEYENYQDHFDFYSQDLRHDFESDLRMTCQVLMWLDVYGKKDLGPKQASKLQGYLKQAKHTLDTEVLHSTIRRFLGTHR